MPCNFFQKVRGKLLCNVRDLKPDFVVAPLDDQTDQYWSLSDDTVIYADSIIDLKNGKGDYCQDDIYKQRFYKKWVYEGKDFTLVFCDPHVDGMKWLRLFDNKKRLNNR